eukprot:scaffold9857_cov195-Amphora_coffeaeformis.AAC.10
MPCLRRRHEKGKRKGTIIIAIVRHGHGRVCMISFYGTVYYMVVTGEFAVVVDGVSFDTSQQKKGNNDSNHHPPSELFPYNGHDIVVNGCTADPDGIDSD